jgi:hypothetical protein
MKDIRAGLTSCGFSSCAKTRHCHTNDGGSRKVIKESWMSKKNLQVRTTNLQVIEFYKSIGFKIDEVASMGKRLEVD